MSGRTVPDPGAAIVGALLQASTAMAGAKLLAAVGDLEKRHFAHPLVGETFELVKAQLARGEDADSVVLADGLKRSARNGMNVGVFLGNLMRDDERLVQPAQIERWAALVREAAARRNGAPDPDDEGAEKEPEGTTSAQVYSVRDFLSLQLAPRRPLLLGPSGSPVLREKDTAMVYAPTGHGKSWLVGGLALCVGSAGRFLKWRAPERRRVLLVDGELPAATLQDRFRVLLPTVEPTADPDLIVLAADVQPEPLPSLATTAGQARIEEHLAGVAALFLDNISTLMPTMDENDASAWEPAQQWLLSLRRRGITTVLAHHAGRAGHARGTSRREDVLDLVIRLNRPTDYAPDQGARFEVSFQKARGVSGEDTQPFEAWLSGGRWTMADVAGRNREAALELLEQGARPGEVSEALGISRAQAFRYQREGRKDGRLPEPKGRKAKRAVS